ncbi:BZ3500_MvSof-1268-A1-R1_Chr9g10419 [Microbotryum saponariae]|uniref:BZ3500_MvSof-1268-A1-R1_Chr9g10419 protein n=1 Tax=Microbotryum saponariae TaxID=289078 RepID=A0A2X0KFF8_9BASI|nr:BZ3501_MvSof-1269-A2-R1_Chr9g10169 [Microbotryum saponariae]SDA00062.1 BZ3500_MvSof-1268-A1-R1_Chr9g10419 [Microbotryum saponariae]
MGPFSNPLRSPHGGTASTSAASTSTSLKSSSSPALGSPSPSSSTSAFQHEQHHARSASFSSPSLGWITGRSPTKGEKLPSDQLLELTRFAHKKVWIDEKINFLASLPPINVTAPAPPEPSTTTAEQLEQWWTEHDRIEEQVQQYDMGDLAHLKRLAKEASQKAMSPKDTDLLEITLTTLFAVDKLLSLLKNRRKALTLLDHRLQWEFQVQQCWQSHRAILADVPSFLSKSRWTVPPTSAPALVSPTSPTTSSFPLDRRSSIFLPSSHPSSSSLNRTLRTDTLSLSLATFKSRLYELSHQLLPESASTLDQLIDNTPEPLPDGFLDEQDRLEDRIELETQGLEMFLIEMKAQWVVADSIWDGLGLTLGMLEKAREGVLAAAEEGEKMEGVEELLRNARTGWELGRNRFRGELIMPNHPTVHDQADENKRLSRTFERAIRKIEAELLEVETLVGEHKRAVEVLRRADEMGQELERVTVALDAFVEAERGLSGRPDLDDARCLDLDAAGFERVQEGLTSKVKVDLLDPLPTLVQTANSIIVDLGKLPTRFTTSKEVRKSVKLRLNELMEGRTRVEKVLRLAQESKKCLEAAQNLSNATKECIALVQGVKQRFSKRIEDVKWHPFRSSPLSPSEDSGELRLALTQVNTQIAKLIPQPFEVARECLATPHPGLYQHLASLVDELHDRSDELKNLDATLESVESQTAAAEGIVQEFKEAEAELEDIRVEIASRGNETNVEELAQLEYRLGSEIDRIEQRIVTTSDGIHERVTFLSTRYEAKKLAEQDSLVRQGLNEAVLRSRAAVVEVRGRLEVLGHRREGLIWDGQHGKAAGDLAALRVRLDQAQRDFSARSTDDPDTLDQHTKRIADLKSHHQLLRPVLDDLTFSHSALSSTRHAEARYPQLERTKAHHDIIGSSITEFERSIEQAGVAYEVRQAAESQAALEASAAAMAARRVQLLAEAVSLKSEATALVEDATKVTAKTEERETTTKEQRTMLLASQDLSLESDVDPSFVEESEQQLVELQARLAELEGRKTALHTQLDQESGDESDDLVATRFFLSECDTQVDCSSTLLDTLQHHVETSRLRQGDWIAARQARVEARQRYSSLQKRIEDVLAGMSRDEQEVEQSSTARRLALDKVVEQRANLSQARHDLLSSSDFNNSIPSPAMDVAGEKIHLEQDLIRLEQLRQRAEARIRARQAIVEDLHTLSSDGEEGVEPLVSLTERSQALDKRLEDHSASLAEFTTVLRGIASDEQDWSERRTALHEEQRRRKEEDQRLDREARTKERSTEIVKMEQILEQVEQKLREQQYAIAEYNALLEVPALDASPRDLAKAVEDLQRADVFDLTKNDLATIEDRRTALLLAAREHEEEKAVTTQLEPLDDRVLLTHSMLESVRLGWKACLEALSSRLFEVERVQENARSGTTTSTTRSPSVAQLREDGLPRVREEHAETSDAASHGTLPGSSGRNLFGAPQHVVDVFGTKSSAPPYEFDTTPEESFEVISLREQLDAIAVDVWLDSKAAQRLPTAEEVVQIKVQVSRVDADLHAFESDTSGAGVWADLDPLKEQLKRKTNSLGQVEKLGHFSNLVVQADKTLSKLLIVIDSVTMESADLDDASSTSSLASDGDSLATATEYPVPEALRLAGEAVTLVRKSAIPFIDDDRVTKNVERIEETYGEMSSMAMDLVPRSPSLPSSSGDGMSDAGTEHAAHVAKALSNSTRSASSLSYVSSSASDSSSRASSAQSNASTTRTPTRPLRLPFMGDPEATPRRRPFLPSIDASPASAKSGVPPVPSFGSSVKARATHRSVSYNPPSTTKPVSTSRRSNRHASNSNTFDSHSMPLSLDAPRGSTSSRSAPRMSPRRTSKSSARPPPRALFDQASTSKSKRKYRANPSRQVDVEVGRIVNELDVSRVESPCLTGFVVLTLTRFLQIDVPIQAAEDAQGSDSGLYWIGDSDTGRYFYCRILRSKTVMVRVGGGWENLHHFIVTRFNSNSVVNLSPQLSPTSARQRSPEPKWITGGGSERESGSLAGRTNLTPSRLGSSRRVSEQHLSPRLSNSSKLASSRSSLLSVSASSFTDSLALGVATGSSSRSRRSSVSHHFAGGSESRAFLAAGSPNISGLVHGSRPTSRNTMSLSTSGSSGTPTVKSPWRP